jgi:hypothetical protein
MALVKYNNNSISAVTAAASIPSGAMTHIKTLTASSSATLSFVDGSSDVVLDSTYPIYVFKFFNLNPATDDKKFQVNFRDGDTNYDATKTTTNFFAFNREGSGDPGFSYSTGNDLAQSTAVQVISESAGNGADESVSGEMTLFNPSSTTFVKHFISRTNTYYTSDISYDVYVAGYCNVTAAIDGVQFSVESGGNFDGTIKLYGIKDS